MAEKKPSLTVLGGALAGTRFLLEGVGTEMLLGSDPACPFRLDLAGVSPQHARIRAEGGAFTIEDAGSEHGLHVNDSRVGAAMPLRNGDIVWLGTPGEADVVMLQCILPARPATAPTPAPPAEAAPAATPAAGAPAADESLSEDETLALALESEAAPARTEIIDAAATAFYTTDEASAAAAPFSADDSGSSAPFAATEEVAQAVVSDEPARQDETVVDHVPFVVDHPPVAPAPPSHFEDDTREQEATYEFAEEAQATVVMAGPDVPQAAAIYSTETGFIEEEPSTVVMASEPEPELEPTVAFEPPRPAAPAPPPTEALPRPPAPPPPAKPAPPPAPAPPATRPAARPPVPSPAPAAPPAPRPARPATPSASSPGASSPSVRRPAARPQPAPRAAADDADAAPARAKSSAPVVLYAGLGVAALAALGGGYWAFTKFLGGTPPTTVAVAPPPTAATPLPPPPTTEPPAEVPVEVLPETPQEEAPTPAPVAPLATPTPAVPTTTLRGAPTPAPTPTPAAKKAAAPPPPTTPAGPTPEQLRAQQVAGLLAQAEAGLASGQYDQAIGQLDEVLRLDPGNAKATADRASAVSLRDAARKKFVSGRTAVKTEKASGGGLEGFDGAAVARTPDFSGRIEFEMSPASGLKPGDAWTLKFFLVNDGKKSIKVGAVSATTNVNGSAAGGPVTGAPKEVAPQQRAPLGQLTGSWREGTTAWTAEVLVTANKGDSLKNTLTWR